MTTKFFHFLKIAEPRHFMRMRLLTSLTVAGVFLLTAIPGAHAGLFSAGKERSQGDTLLGQANTAFQAGDYAGALRLLEQVEALKPDQADAWNLRGVVFLKQKAYDKAEAAFARAVTIDPTLWAAQFNLAETPFQKKDFARAKSVFEHLLAQTDRYKSAGRWELVLYKAFLCALLTGDEADARKKLAKLPATGGATPAFQYAQAALAFSRKDPAGANKILSGAQTAYASALNGMFTSSLETAGWQVPAMNPGSSLVVATTDPTTAAAMNAAGITNPGNTTSSAGGARGAPQHPVVVIDPRMVAAASDPLPSSPGREVMPVVGQAAPSLMGRTASGTARHSASKEDAAASSTTKPSSTSLPPPAATPPASPLEQDGLLMGLD